MTYYVPAKTDIELTGTTNPTYNGFVSESYFDGTGDVHYGTDIVAGIYTSIGAGTVDYVDANSVGGGVVIRHSYSNTHDLLALYWHGKPLVSKGAKVDENTYVTDSRSPSASIGTMGKHTHFELRLVKKGLAFIYYDPKRACQAIHPFSILTVRSGVNVGSNLTNHLAHFGISISGNTANNTQLQTQISTLQAQVNSLQTQLNAANTKITNAKNALG